MDDKEALAAVNKADSWLSMFIASVFVNLANNPHVALAVFIIWTVAWLWLGFKISA